MRNIYYYIVILICISVSTNAQNISCYHLHNGRFKIIDSVHKSFVLIERKDSVEKQYIYKNDTSQYDMKLLFKIEWQNDCTYKAYLVENIIHTKRGDKYIPTGKRVLTNRIMLTDNNSYVVYTDMNTGVKFANRVLIIK